MYKSFLIKFVNKITGELWEKIYMGKDRQEANGKCRSELYAKYGSLKDWQYQGMEEL